MSRTQRLTTLGELNEADYYCLVKDGPVRVWLDHKTGDPTPCFAVTLYRNIDTGELFEEPNCPHDRIMRNESGDHFWCGRCGTDLPRTD